MITFRTTILQFESQGEKTGWRYIRISAAQAQELMPGNKKSFRVKGLLDDHAVKGIALLPMGKGDFIMALNATVRKALRKQQGAPLKVSLEVDSKKIEPPKDLLDCLADEPGAHEYFKSLPKSHQNYFGTWVKAAKADATRARRIARVVDAMLNKKDFGQMMRIQKQDREDRMDH